MKRILYILIMCSALLSCDKLPANGDLDGMWQIMEIEHDGVVTDMKSDRVYMSIQLKLCQLEIKPKGITYYGYFERADNTIRFWQFSYRSRNESAADNNLEIEEENIELLHPFGFHSLQESFTIDKLTKDDLIMHNASTKITYRKF